MLKELEKEILELRIQLEKTSNKELRKVLAEQKKQIERIRELVGSMYMEYGENLQMSEAEKFNVKQKFKNEIKEMNESIGLFEVGVVGVILHEAFKSSYYKTAYTIDKGIELRVGINYKILRPEFVDAVVNANFEGQNFSSRIWKNKEWLANKLNDVIGEGIKKGYSVDKLSKEIKDSFGASAYQSRRLVNTELARVVTNAQDEIYKSSGLVDRVMYVATLDNLTSQICQDRDGGIWDLKDINKPVIPAHPNCRSVWVPYIEGWNPKQRRDNLKKENIEYRTYSEWEKENNIS